TNGFSFAGLHGTSGTIGQETVNYSWSGNTLTATGPRGVLFTVTVTNAATGAYTVELKDNVLHTAGPNGEDNVSVGLGYTVTDADNSVANGTLTVAFNDDAPLAVLPDHAIVTNAAGSPVIFELDQDGTLNNNYGADGAGTVRFPSSLGSQASGLTANGVPIVYHVSPDGLTLTGFAGATSIFVINLNPTNATYSVDMNGKVDSTTNVSFSGSSYDFVGGNAPWAGFIAAGETVSHPIDNNSPDLLLTPAINGLPAGTINTSANSGGVSGGGSVGNGETFRIDFVTDLRGDPSGTGGGDYDVLLKRDHVFDAHYTVNGSTASFISDGSTVKITAFDDPDGDTIVGNGSKDAVTAVVIAYNGSSQIVDLTPALQQTYTITVGGHTFTVSENLDGSVSVGNVYGDNSQSTQIGIFTANGYNSVEYTWAAGDPFKLGQFGAAVPTTKPVSFDVPIEVVDGDGDRASSSIDVTLTAAGQGIQDYSLAASGQTATATSPNPHIIGSDLDDTLNGNSSDNALDGNAGTDFLYGNGGDDILYGGTGSDHISGGAGVDTFVIDADSLLPGIDDVITDYNYAEGDTVDLTALLGNLPTGTNLDGNFVQVVQDGLNANLQVDTDGSAGNASAWHTVAVLEDFQVSTEVVKILFTENGAPKTQDVS
ncbi:type I secretion C-terminal target domain-containing protein, partial [Ensifer sp. ENS10]|uniref:calcium-binding protein n=1 Tax=Ensifer sp. ENS10 TaxID=2769286 RepID=UPI0017849FCA